MSSIFSNDTNALFGYESLLARMQKSLQTTGNTSFSDCVKNASLSSVLNENLSINENINFGLGDFTIVCSKQGAFLNVINGIETERTSITTSTLLSQTQTNLFQNTYKVEFNSIEKEQFEAIANALKADERLLEQNNALGLEPVFFRDSSSLEFSQKALSKESLNALKEQFGEESVYRRKDGVYVLNAEAEKFVSGWSKALDKANEKNQTNTSLDELIQKDKDFSSHLDESELDSSFTLMTTTTIVEQITWISALVVKLFDLNKNDFLSLQEYMNTRFNNFDIFARNFISENLEGLFENKNESINEQNSNVEDKNSNEDKTKKFANFFENNFMKISQYFTNSSLSSSSFASLSSVVFDMAQTLYNQSLANADLKQDSLASSNQSELKA
ncbi:hypothetical protein [Campylobacter sp. MIT 97-5078]|uniref:hypothetical protein n=1 Tax=Campylobacter sp. MIT 97-5078 TaxID=1548153 RepID=UPI0005140322|nr:hypothetical protein [Campylobacter sp. MIT 97-5078]KGI57299.1 hypothetical protein LR59_00730 [Campylobacter sp. MIT 97-5078]TQR28237.1 hypothetical protein DMB91_00865 [Campylobacter sp. MIT 97-5078]